MDMAKPIIRFKGYQDDWEQRKLPEFVSFFNGLTYTPDDVEETGTLVLRSSNVKNGEIVDADNVYVNDKVVTSENVHEGDIIVVVRNGSRALIGKHAQIKDSMPNTVIGAFMSGMRSEHSSFVNALLDTSAFENEIAKNMGATINQITGYMFSKMEFMIPSGNEQQTIGEYFQSLDNLITLHQRKCDETKRLKKYMLQKMFPQNGEKVPEIRFSGFTDDWEQRKLSEIALQTYGGGTPKTANEEFWKGNIPWIQSSDLIEERLFNVKPRKYISQEAISKSATKLVPQNSVAMVTRVGVGKLAFMPFSYATSQDFLSLSELKIEPEFVVYALYKMMRLVSNEVQGTSIKGITKDELLAKEILIPDCEEQKKIGAYLHNLDHLITLHQRELENLQNIKRFMLGKMFV